MAHFSERRMHERYRLDLPCLLSLDEDRVTTTVVELRARDISGGGAFLDLAAADIGATARLDIIIPAGLNRCEDGGATHISASGSVVRMEAGGIAVSFFEDYRISPLDEVLKTVKAKMNWLAGQVCEPGALGLKNILHIKQAGMLGSDKARTPGCQEAGKGK
jgi:hypothetical protein